MRSTRVFLAMAFAAGIAFGSLSQSTSFSPQPDTSDFPYWIDMMQDETVNFYDVQRAFNQYWEGRPVERGSGYKPFKRWEYRMQQFGINPDGSRRAADYVLREYEQYMQSHPGSRSGSGNWVNLGPFSIPGSRGYEGLGRINAIAFHPTDPNTLWIGAPAGGLWKTETNGNSWESTTQHLPSLGVSSILVDYNNPDVIYIGTGDRDAGDADGIGVWKTTDGGQTWEEWSTGMGNRIVGRMIMHPTNNLVILAATNGGIYRTNNGGASWTLVQSGNFKEVVFKSDDPTIVYAASGGDFYRSTDTGQSFSMNNNGLPGGSRAVIAVTPADPNYVYFLVANGDSFKGLYRSTDAGLSFTMRSNTPNIMSWGCNGGDGGQAWYDLDMAADPNDKEVIYAGGVNCFKSTNGGMNWNISSHWWGDCNRPAVHADLHILEYNPLNDWLYVGNDGGIYYTDNDGSSWPEITSGLPISQVYKIGQSATVRDKVINGYQDNGTSTLVGSSWLTTRGGDGMECAIDHQNADYSYATVYYGSITRHYQNNYNATVAENGIYGIDEDGDWITPFILDENDAAIMFVGYKNVWRCNNVKAPNGTLVWRKISDGLGGNNGSNMRVLEQSPANTEILYTVKFDNNMFRTDESYAESPAWFDLTSNLPSSGGVLDVECHPTDPEVVFISQNNNIYKSTDRGLTWEDISGSLPNVSYTSIAFYKNSHEGLYISSNLGVYYRDAFMSDWIMFSDGLPLDASINELEIFYDTEDPADDVIRAGTYGRGLWESDMYHTLPIANFTTKETTIPVGCAIDFTDLSCGVPTSWNWTFEGAVPSTCISRNPCGFTYYEAGTYPVTLVVGNEAGTDSLTITDYITVSEEIMPDAGFYADDRNICVNGYVHFTDTSKYCPTEWEWSFQPGTIYYREGTNANSQHPVVEFRVQGMYTVTLTVGNGNGQSTVVMEEYIQAGGYSLPFLEDFEMASLDERSWSVVNPDYNYTWQLFDIEETGNKAARMKFYGYFYIGERDRLISPLINLWGQNEAFLTFDHAYAQRFSQKDSLIVYLSYDCGETWNRIWQGGPDGTGIFATAPATPYEFVPLTEEDWCGAGWGAECTVIDISEWAGQTNVQLMFESYNSLGNNLYLDNIMVSNTTGTKEALPGRADGISIYPNPSKGIFTLGPGGMEGRVLLEVINPMGQVAYQESFTLHGPSKALNLGFLPQGIYVLRLTDSSGSVAARLVIE